MSNGHVEGFHYLTGRATRVSWVDGQITSVEPALAIPAGRWIAPSLFDAQVNGYGGIDFQQDDLTADDLLAASRALRRDGCARFFFTLITAEWPRLIERLARARKLRNEHPELRGAIAGWHVEGPFLSDKPGFCGAHDPSLMLDPAPARIRELREVAGNDPLLLTVAPEREGSLEAIRLARSLGITISLGHTNASAEVLSAAVAAGASGFTHLANGCPRELDRHDNVIWRVCDTAGLTVSLIPDGIHVSAAPFRHLHKLLPTIYYTTDAMAAAGSGPGRYRIGKVDVEVGIDQIVRQPGKTNFAGSALKPIDGVRRASDMLGQPWQECWRRMSEIPAAFVGVRHAIAPGMPAALMLIQESASAGLVVEPL